MCGQTQILIEFSAHLLKSNYYQVVSIIFSNFPSMDLYQFTKYESISERIKRLASPSSAPSPYSALQTASKTRPFLSPPSTINQKYQDQKSFRVTFQEKTAPSRAATQQTDRNLNQQSQTLINDLLSIRDYQASKVQKKDGRLALTEEQTEERSFISEQKKQKIANLWKNEKEDVEQIPKKAELNKVKSESSLKLDQILESYNSYKQNKQRFLSDMEQNPGKQHQRVISQNLKQYFENNHEEQQRPSTTLRNAQSRLSQIESLWNEVPGSNQLISFDKEELKENQPQFKRSKNNRFDQFSELKKLRVTDVKDDREPFEEIKPHRKSLSKLILRNVRTEKEPQEPQAVLNMALSPRGLRVPGKICRNVDRSMMAPPRWAE